MSEKRECTRGCVNGKYFDLFLRKRVKCDICWEDRSEEVRDGILYEGESRVSLRDAIGLNTEGANIGYDFDQIISKAASVYATRDSLDLMKENIEIVRNGILLGDLPKENVCFGLFMESNILQLGYSLLLDAYKNGFNIAPLVTTSRYNRAAQAEKGIVSEYQYGQYQRMLSKLDESDFCVMLISVGQKLNVDIARDFMQNRIIDGKSTVFITQRSRSSMETLVGSDESKWSNTQFTARGVFLSPTYNDKETVTENKDGLAMSGTRSTL